MILKQLKPRKALNKAYLKLKPDRERIDLFKANLIELLDRIDDSESEEFHKNLISDFLKSTYYKDNHFINTKERADLVIHNGNNRASTVGVIIETKRPTNKWEMITPGEINAKAFHELLLYYLRERITNGNREIHNLIVTNIHEWFIFDSAVFERNFAQNKALIRQFEAFEKSKQRTEVFYTEIAHPFIENLNNVIEFTYFDIRDYNHPLRNDNPDDDNKLIALYKLLSAEHLLNLPFANDSNTLDKSFYGELLHIMGLSESKEGGKKVIGRDTEGKRNIGSLIENAINELDSLDKMSRLDRPSQYGDTMQERLFNVALELTITWMNRILFMKLLEAQLIKYHKGNTQYEFLNIDKIHNYDDLNSLFFKVLARKLQDRGVTTKETFDKVPYLNSSLFEPTELEHTTLFVSNLGDSRELPIYSATVLKDGNGKRRTGKMNPLEYLFEFLDSYDFTSEGSEAIQEDNKTLINASVLGLIFEKINGYKDGSFFTPGFITMYMCRETIRKAVLQKFNETKGWKYTNFDDLYDEIDDRKEANDIINSLKICDPAVGSGHFLVSALNEIIAIKNDLRILSDRDGRRLKEYHVVVENDELIVYDEEDVIFEYNPTSRESQRVQEALFHEKQTIIESCLFGVDINPNSVKICRLRLWIELLKNAYYKNETELETLPNIDINIKCGNSLVSRFALDADLSDVLKRNQWNIDYYRDKVSRYRNARSREEKQAMKALIDELKKDFETEIAYNDPKKIRLRKVRGLLDLKTIKDVFESKEHQRKNKKETKKLKNDFNKLIKEIAEIEKNKIFENAFEWRFEFPEVLNDDGDFVGFDVVIGNPPYFIMTRNNTEKQELSHYLNNYSTIKNASSKNIFNLFIEVGILISNNHSFHSMIVPEGLFETRSYSDTIKLFEEFGSVLNITRIEGMVFDEANTGNVIFIYGKNKVLESPEEKLFDKNKNLLDFVKKVDSIILKLDKPDIPKLSEFCMLFKGMVVSDRKNNIFEERSEELPNKFLLGNCISKWKINKHFYTNYDQLKIVGGTKVKAKHDVSPRILIRRTGDYLCCAYLTEPALTESTLYSCWSIKEDIHNLFILGILHSKVADYYIKNKLVTNKQAFPQILMTDLQLLPIPYPSTSMHDNIKNLTERRLYNLEDELTLESEIDQLVYELYGLTEEEIGIVENSLK